MEVIKLIKRKKTLVYFLLSIFLLFNFFNMSLPKHLSVYENSFSHVSANNDYNYEQSTAVVENNTVKVTENIEIDVIKGTDIKAENAGNYKAKYTFLGIPVKSVNLNVVPKKRVIPCGNILGIVIETKGVLVLGTGKVKDEYGNEVSPCSGMLKSGDNVIAINGQTITSKEELTSIVSNSEGKSLNISVIRDDETLNADITPVISENDGQYKIGCWVRDDTQGLGTLTFIDPQNNTFGALGHGIYDVDTNMLMNTSGGIVTLSHVSGVKKGEKGVPGEVKGDIDKEKVFGSIFSNTNYGISGSITKPTLCPSISDEAIEVAISKDVHTGKAFIKSDILGQNELYEVEIENINRLDITSDKSMTIKIVDERLLNSTGGIVQGMSGSPIIQDGKLVGAVTHVFVKDPTKGYGIFIENMMG